ncbi:MAG: hypothetical protein IJP95_06765 [Bacteroidales bacterium]|nr:hypothetical protein [Bacteroidales bacterium]
MCGFFRAAATGGAEILEIIKKTAGNDRQPHSHGAGAARQTKSIVTARLCRHGYGTAKYTKICQTKPQNTAEQPRA